MNDELKGILKKFADSGWDLIDAPSSEYLKGAIGKDTLIKAIREADSQCGNCGCDFDPLYKRALEIL